MTPRDAATKTAAPETKRERTAATDPLRPPDTAPGTVRDWVWSTLARRRQVGYPLPPHGHHPNFTGAGKAADVLLGHLLETRALIPGQSVLCYPDLVLKPLRKRLLEAGVSVVVPAQHGDHYRLLRSGVVAANTSSSIAGAEREGDDVATLELLPEPVAFTFVACVAVSRTGQVLTKGYGFALPTEVCDLPSATVVHPLQVLAGLEPDAPAVSYFATPTELTKLE